ncbi:helix-turn-helix transcriptional regulator [Mesorhizobium sp. BR1-1-2]|uniref:helix-turn-helix transcriptional regulator n=1 Tax=Mesorhizobium sp. BR1-1-2 TaxID=2876652 RepID=UPI001CCE8923|nr:helix-turn-helix transcriptional regulator [Mesorhizobium sp. BR1-1-2]MBZ9963731.1 helix-turn-helix transcriptional regulator [Mesorhizobium sp. BR1-1-2]
MSAALDFREISTAFAKAAVDPSQWGAAMDVAEAVTGSAGALLFDLNGHLPRIPHSRSTVGSFEAYVRDGWIHRDERYRLIPFLRRKGVTTDLDIFTSEEIDRHPYYQEFLAHFDLRWYAGVKVAAGEDTWCLSLQRSIKQGPFRPEELAALANLSRKLGSFAALSRTLGFARIEATIEAFDASVTPVIMIDRNGRAIRLNRSAELSLGQHLRISNQRLVARDRAAAAALDRSLHILIRSRDSGCSVPPVAIPRIGQRPLLAYMLRLPALSPNALAPCQATIMLVDPDLRRQPPEITLRACFGLTSSEAKLACLISLGETVERSADQLGVCYETARNHLKAIFAKTDTHRQGELVSMLAKMATGPSAEKL